MKNIKLIFVCLIYLLSNINSQSLFAQKVLQEYDGKVKRNLKDSVEVDFYELKNKDLMLIIDFFINEWEKSLCYEPIYLGIYTSPLAKQDSTSIQKVEDRNKAENCWSITIKSFRCKNFVEHFPFSWGCFRYKNRLFDLGGYPCEELFYSLKKKLVFNYYPSYGRGDLDAYPVSIMSWSYKYSDKHFIATERKVCK